MLQPKITPDRHPQTPSYQSRVFDVEPDLYRIHCAALALHYLCEAGGMDEPTSAAVYGLASTIGDHRDTVVETLYGVPYSGVEGVGDKLRQERAK